MLMPIITSNIVLGSTVSTDTAATYATLPENFYQHGTVNHAAKQWRSGIYCTNTIEGFWSHFKRGIVSTHVYVLPQHMQKHIGEFAFRYNNRSQPGEMFARLLKQISA